MTFLVPQTPTAEPTRTAIYRSLSRTPPNEEASQIEALLDGFGRNHAGRYDGAHPVDQVRGRIEALRALPEGWNGYDVAAPDPASLERAHWWIRSLYRDAQANAAGVWLDPHVSANENGDVTFEWTRGGKTLLATVSATESWYVKAWGADMDAEMSDGSADSPEERREVWAWLAA